MAHEKSWLILPYECPPSGYILKFTLDSKFTMCVLKT